MMLVNDELQNQHFEFKNRLTDKIEQFDNLEILIVDELEKQARFIQQRLFERKIISMKKGTGSPLPSISKHDNLLNDSKMHSSDIIQETKTEEETSSTQNLENSAILSHSFQGNKSKRNEWPGNCFQMKKELQKIVIPEI